MKRRYCGVLMATAGLGIVLAGGCSPKASGPVVSEGQVTGQMQATEYKTSDGWQIHGDVYLTQGASKGVVVLLHQRGGSADDWAPLATAIQQAGYTAFAIDARGTGRSTQGPGQSGEFAPWNTEGDIEGAIFGLRDKGPAMLIGASYGANNALLYAAAHPDLIRGLVLFSPSTDYHGLQTLGAVKKYTGPILIFHQKGDAVAGDGPETLAKASGSKDHTLKVSDGSGHGTALLNAQTTQETVDFIARTLK